MGSNICTVKEYTASVFVSNDIRLKLNDKKTKYMVMSRDQHAVQNHDIYIYICRFSQNFLLGSLVKFTKNFFPVFVQVEQ